MGLRRHTRLTNAFSRKIENHSAAVALYYFAYNFIKIHGTLRCMPAMAAGVTDRLWEVSDLVALLEADERGLERSGVNRCTIKAKVPDYLPRDLSDAQWSRAQGALIDFLNADLDLAFTLLRTADIEVSHDPKGCGLALAKVRAALAAIRRLKGRVDSDLARGEIDARADELETGIGTFRP
jgi:hypothetical protein